MPSSSTDALACSFPQFSIIFLCRALRHDSFACAATDGGSSNDTDRTTGLVSSHAYSLLRAVRVSCLFLSIYPGAHLGIGASCILEKNTRIFIYLLFYLYIYPPDLQESDGSAIGNYPDLLPEMPRYCCPLVI